MQNLIRFVNQVFSGLRFRLLLMVTIACAPLVSLILHTASDDRRRAMENWQQRSERVLEIARREDEKLIGETRRLLVALAESAPIRNGNRRGSMELVDKLNLYPRYANLGVTGTNGEVLATAASLPVGTNHSQHEFFRRVLDTASFIIDDLPANESNNAPIINFGY